MRTRIHTRKYTHARSTRTHTQVFLGSLRESEVELINDRLSQAVMETCLAMTIFQREFNVEFVAMFVALTFFKVPTFPLAGLPGWGARMGCRDRLDSVEWTMPSVSRLTTPCALQICLRTVRV